MAYSRVAEELIKMYGKEQLKQVFEKCQLKKAKSLQEFQKQDRKIVKLILKQAGCVNLLKANYYTIGRITNDLKELCGLQRKHILAN